MAEFLRSFQLQVNSRWLLDRPNNGGGKKCPVISSRADTSSAGLATTPTTTKPKVMKVKSNRHRFQRDSLAYILLSSHRPPTT